MKTKIGLREVAQEAGVSLSTASHALNGTAPLTNEVRDRVISCAQRLGYLEKRRNKASIASLRAIIVAVTGDAAPQSDLNMVSWTVMNGLRQECERRAIRIVPSISQGKSIDASEIKRLSQAENVDGIIILNDDRSELIRSLSQLPIPTVIMNGEDPAMLLDTVTAGNRFGARQATEYLLSLGHRRILHLTWPGRTTIRRRFDGYVDAFLAADRQVPTDMVVEAASFEPEEGEKAIRTLLAKDSSLKGATAIFCAADNLALGCLKALREAGIRVPDDISVMGCDDIMPAEFSSPPLSTVQLPTARLGTAALSLMEQRVIANDPLRPAHRLELGCKLVLRGSVAPPRQ